tara:strand:+ start:5609 stop:7942 length:2334 start_codon:yes stop_codon:yes gene_type:complete
MSTTEDSRTDREFRRFLQWAESKGGLDKQMRQSRGDIGAYDTGHSDAGIEYFTVNAEGQEGAGLYDDQPGDYFDFPWAYREHPDYRKYWGRGNAYVGFIPERQPFVPPEPPEIRQSVLSTLGSDSLIEDTNQSFVSRVSDASNVQNQLTASTQSALQEIKKDPSLPFVGAVRQSFLEDEDEDVEPLSSPQANILRSFLEQAQQQRVQDSPAFQQRRQAIASILQTNPAFLSRQLQQVTSANVEQTEPKFTNILEEIATDPVEALQQTTTPVDFVRTFEEVDGGGFDEDGEDSFTSTSTTSLGDAFGGLFGEEDSEPAFGDFSSAQMSQAAQTISQSETTFSNEQSSMPTPAEIAAAKAEGKNTLAMQAERTASLFGTRASIFGDKMNNPQTLGTMIAQNVAEGFVMGANPALAAPIAGGLLTPAGLIVAPVIAGIGAAADIANSTFSGFGFGNFMSALFNGLTFGLIGDSIEDQENEQAEKDLLVEDIFSNPFQTKDKDQEFGKLVDQTKTEEAIRSEIQLAKEIQKYEQIAKDIRTYKEKESYQDPAGGDPGGISGPTAGMSIDEGTFGVFGLDTGDYENGDSPSDGDGDGDGDGAGSACWVAGTQILMADNTYRNIEDLKIGDMVMSYPETKKTRRWNTPLEARPIVSLLVDVHPEIWHLNDSMVSGTEWMIKGDGTAAIVQWLNVGDTVLGPDNNLVEITRVEPAEGQLKKQVIYNFETENNYTYIADGMRTIRGRAVRGEQWGKSYLSGDTNSYEGSMKDEYVRKFDTIKNAA